MKKIITAGVTALMLSSVLAVPVAQAASRGDRERYVQRYCATHKNDRDCRDFSKNRSSWNDRRYNDWYGRHRSNGGGDAAAAIFGLAAGAALGAAAANSRQPAPAEYDEYDDHEARCARAYRSYDPNTDTYAVNSDGDRARCRL